MKSQSNSQYPLERHDPQYGSHVYRLTYFDGEYWQVGCSCGYNFTPEPEYAAIDTIEQKIKERFS